MNEPDQIVLVNREPLEIGSSSRHFEGSDDYTNYRKVIIAIEDGEWPLYRAGLGPSVARHRDRYSHSPP